MAFRHGMEPLSQAIGDSPSATGLYPLMVFDQVKNPVLILSKYRLEECTLAIHLMSFGLALTRRLKPVSEGLQ